MSDPDFIGRFLCLQSEKQTPITHTLVNTFGHEFLPCKTREFLPFENRLTARHIMTWFCAAQARWTWLLWLPHLQSTLHATAYSSSRPSLIPQQQHWGTHCGIHLWTLLWWRWWRQWSTKRKEDILMPSIGAQLGEFFFLLSRKKLVSNSTFWFSLVRLVSGENLSYHVHKAIRLTDSCPI